MKGKCAFFVALIVIVLTIPSLAQESTLGKVSFANSCDAKVKELVNRGVAMLHSFWYSAGEKTFREVLTRDPSCVIAAWGIASLLMSNPLAGAGSSPQGAAEANAAIEYGRKVGARTQRERDYIESVAAYYENWANRPEIDRQRSRAKAYEALAARYPDDDEAQIFYALYLAGTQSQAEQTYASYLNAASILEKQFTKYPDHPGVAHYLIHSYDAPPIAEKGLPAARRYASIAPAAPHALHMPSHIFTRVGAWEESAATNRRSADTAKQNNDKDEQMHALDYMAYAYLQLARDHEARMILDEAAKVSGFTRPAGPYAFAAIPARYAIERGDWSGAMKLQPMANNFHYTEALTRFARALGAARSGDSDFADTEVGHLSRLRDALKAAKEEYWATEVEVSRLGASAWIALASGKSDEALQLMRRAADIEDKNEKHIVTPGRILPARELLGQMLLELNQPAEALKEFEASQKREPNRFHGFAGAARAAAQSGDPVKAKQYYVRLIELTAKAGVTRPELEQAKTFLAQR
jgi:tetratricopeptide (TPR) repeat protein